MEGIAGVMGTRIVVGCSSVMHNSSPRMGYVWRRIEAESRWSLTLELRGGIKIIISVVP